VSPYRKPDPPAPELEPKKREPREAIIELDHLPIALFCIAVGSAFADWFVGTNLLTNVAGAVTALAIGVLIPRGIQRRHQKMLEDTER
jgi:cyanate permease